MKQMHDSADSGGVNGVAFILFDADCVNLHEWDAEQAG